MSEDGLDDELIALVGEDAPTQHDAPRSHDKRSALLSDLSDDEDAEGDDDIVSSSESSRGAERFARFSIRTRARARPPPPGETPESVAQSLEGMSISPFAV